MGCLPEYYVNGIYIPNFTSGSTPSILQSINERRARLYKEQQPSPPLGVFFRSITSDNIANNIQIKCDWYDGPTSSGSVTGNITTNQANVQSVRLEITDGSVIEVYAADQSGSGLPFVWTTSAIPSLRSQINTNSILITMPTLDDFSGWDASSQEDDHISYFAFEFLTGAIGIPNDPSTVRTGPIYSIINIAETDQHPDGIIDSSNPSRKTWDGTSWVKFDPPDFPPHIDDVTLSPCT